MDPSTVMPVARGFAFDGMFSQVSETEAFEPRKERFATTLPSLGDVPTSGDRFPDIKVSPPVPRQTIKVRANSTPLQIWEGTVVDVDVDGRVMSVYLDAKMGSLDRHAAEIDLEWVSEQDEDLVKPGAVFYLTLYKMTSRGSIKNAQELRFRRRPSWSSAQVKRVRADAEALMSKMKEPSTAV